MISVIIGATRSISRSFRKYLSNIPGKHEISRVQKKKIAELDIAHNCNLESINAKCKTYVTCEITL